MYTSPNSLSLVILIALWWSSVAKMIQAVSILRAILILKGFCLFVHRSKSPQACTNYIHNQMRFVSLLMTLIFCNIQAYIQ